MQITKDALLQRRAELAQLVERANVQAQQGLGRIAEIDVLIEHLATPDCEEKPPLAKQKPKAPRKPRTKKTETPAAQ